MKKNRPVFFLFLSLLLILSVNTVSVYAEDSELTSSGSNDFLELIDLTEISTEITNLTNQIEINSCQVLNQTGATYILGEDILDIDAETCLDIRGNNIIFDCNGKSIKPLSVFITIRISGNNTLVKNCDLESISAKQGYQGKYVSEGIYIDHARNVTIRNNRITNFYYGIMAEGSGHFIIDNAFFKNRDGIFLENSFNNLLKQNYIANQIYSSIVIRDGYENTLDNNKGTGNIANVHARNVTIYCGHYKGIEFNYYDQNFVARGTIFENMPVNKAFTYFEDDCNDLDCFWVNDTCVTGVSNNGCEDKDNDGFYEFNLENCYSGKDCEDNNSLIHPGVEDLCWNNIDENCDGKIRDCREINACGTYNTPGVDYFLAKNLTNVTPICLDFGADHVSLDCQGHLVETDKNRALQCNPLIYIHGNYGVVKNCLVNSNHNVSGYNTQIGYGAITLKGGFGTIENNVINGGRGGIYIDGSYNLVNKNKINNSYTGIATYLGSFSIFKNNLIKNSNQGISVRFSLSNTNFINNYVYNNVYGISIDGKDTTIKCGKYINNSGIDLRFLSNSERITALGAIFNTSGGNNKAFVFKNDSCKYIDCRWFGDECLVDADWDNVPDKNDLCLETPGEEEVNENGCSCSQIDIPFRDCLTSGCYNEDNKTYPEDGYDICVAGIITEEHSCELINSEYSLECDTDDDNDGVLDVSDFCPNTIIPELDLKRLIVNRYSDVDGDKIFETRAGIFRPITDSKYTLNSTKGCSCIQLLDLKPGKDIGEVMFGCTEKTIKEFVNKKNKEEKDKKDREDKNRKDKEDEQKKVIRLGK